MHLQTTHTLSDNPDFISVLDEFRDAAERQWLLLHFEFRRFSPSALKRAHAEWRLFRSITDAPIFATEPNPDDQLWGKFVSRMGFKETPARHLCSDGLSRRLFISLKDGVNALTKHPNTEAGH